MANEDHDRNQEDQLYHHRLEKEQIEIRKEEQKAAHKVQYDQHAHSTRADVQRANRSSADSFNHVREHRGVNPRAGK